MAPRWDFFRLMTHGGIPASHGERGEAERTLGMRSQWLFHDPSTQAIRPCARARSCHCRTEYRWSSPSAGLIPLDHARKWCRARSQPLFAPRKGSRLNFQAARSDCATGRSPSPPSPAAPPLPIQRSCWQQHCCPNAVDKGLKYLPG